MTGEPPGEWVSVAEAARRLGVTSRAVRARIKHRTIIFRPKGNAGREVFIPDGTIPRGMSAEAQGIILAESPPELPELAELRDALTEERIARARAEGELVARDALLTAKDALVAELRARSERAEAALVEARKPVLLRLLEALRRR